MDSEIRDYLFNNDIYDSNCIITTGKTMFKYKYERNVNFNGVIKDHYDFHFVEPLVQDDDIPEECHYFDISQLKIIFEEGVKLEIGANYYLKCGLLSINTKTFLVCFNYFKL